MTVDFEKAFDSLIYSFLLACLKKFGFGHDFIRSKYYLKVKNLVSSIQELQRHTSILKMASAKVIQFLLFFYFMS